jgi:hypothetical protein
MLLYILEQRKAYIVYVMFITTVIISITEDTYLHYDKA